MAYQKPFTFEQRQNAIAIYRSFRRTIAAIRDRFPPTNEQQRALVREFRDVVRDFGDALQMENAKVDVARLNALRQTGDRLALRYSHLRLPSIGSDLDE